MNKAMNQPKVFTAITASTVFLACASVASVASVAQAQTQEQAVNLYSARHYSTDEAL